MDSDNAEIAALVEAWPIPDNAPITLDARRQIAAAMSEGEPAGAAIPILAVALGELESRINEVLQRRTE